MSVGVYIALSFFVCSCNQLTSLQVLSHCKLSHPSVLCCMNNCVFPSVKQYVQFCTAIATQCICLCWFSGSNLRELFLRKSHMTEFSQLQPLQQLKSLKVRSMHVVCAGYRMLVLQVLWLSGNPIEQQTDYRATVIQMFPQLLSLDDSSTAAYIYRLYSCVPSAI